MAYSTATTPVQLKQYRERHTITSIRAFDDDTERMVDVCRHDGIRLYAQRGRWIHDPSEIKELARLERGEKIDWAIR